MSPDRRPRNHELSLEERRHRESTRWRRSLLASGAVHLLVASLLFGFGTAVIPDSPFSAAGPQNADDRAAAGGMQVVTVRAPEQRPVVRPPPPIETPSFEQVDVVDFAEVPEIEVDLAQMAGELPDPDVGPGTEAGEGQGDGGTTEEGRFTVVPPSPRGMIIPPTNGDLRGSEFEVWVFVDTRGRVVPDSTRLDPPTSDGDYNRRLIREAAEWVFTPASRGGEPVAAWFPYRISMEERR